MEMEDLVLRLESGEIISITNSKHANAFAGYLLQIPEYRNKYSMTTLEGKYLFGPTVKLYPPAQPKPEARAPLLEQECIVIYKQFKNQHGQVDVDITKNPFDAYLYLCSQLGSKSEQLRWEWQDKICRFYLVGK